MANTFVVSRSQLVYGICLPLAVLVGYLLASPFESGSVAVVVLVLTVLSIPILMRWHHPLLIIGWNAFISPAFLPGRPTLWAILAAASLFFSLLNRSLGHEINFYLARSVSKSLLFIGAVVGITAFMRGGIGVAALGGGNFGGKKYFYIFAAIAGYFAMSSHQIPKKRIGLYVALFFLAGVTSIISYAVLWGGSSFYFLLSLFPQSVDTDDGMIADDLYGGDGIYRLGEVSTASRAIFCFLLARFGIRGLLDVKRPWRAVLFALVSVTSMLGGFRTIMTMLVLTFLVVFWLEGLFRTRYVLVMLLIGAMACAVGAPYFHKMPLSIQRALSFLPVSMDPIVRQSAEGSINWRVEMWREVLPEVPQYLIKGKGYNIDPNDLFLVSESAMRGYVGSAEVYRLAGDYHNGPLSVLIPFGIAGMVGFLWFLWAAGRVFYQNYRNGDPALYRINTFLFAYFIVNVIHFFFIYGSFHSDMFLFAGLTGLSVCLNGGVSEPREELPEPVEEG